MQDRAFENQPLPSRRDTDTGYETSGTLDAQAPAHDTRKPGSADTIAGSETSGSVPEVLKRGSRRDSTHLPT